MNIGKESTKYLRYSSRATATMDVTMKVALIRNHDRCLNSRQISMMQRRAGVLPHLGLGYIETSLLREGVETVTFDAQAEGWDSRQLYERLANFRPDLVGVTTTTPGLRGAIEAIQVAKRCGAVTILGGPHTEVFGKENLFHDCLDYVGVGEGASIMPELTARLASGASVEDVPGLLGRGFSNPAAPNLNLEAMGWPSRASIPVGRYHSIMARRPFATMISSRGCPFQCSFCFKQAVDRKSLFRPAYDVVDEMEWLAKHHGIKEIMFYDDVFTMKRKRVFEICSLIVERRLKVRWEAPTRADLVDAEMLTMMANAGCVRLRFGLESGNSDILQSMRKHIDLAEIEKAIRLTKNAGIETFAYFIVGWLGETRAQFEETIGMAIRLKLDYATFYTATPLPGTQLHREAVRAMKIEPDYWSKYVRGQVEDRIGLLADGAESRAQEAYRRFYIRWRKAPTLVRHLCRPGSFISVAGGLASLIKSTTNTARDF